MTNIVKTIIFTSAMAAGVILGLAAEAANFNFSYINNNGDVLAGMLKGDLHSDKDTVIVSAITMPTVNGISAPEITFIDSISSEVPIVSLSGLMMDILACNSVDCDDGFLFSNILGLPLYVSTPSYGNGSSFEIYNPDNWNLTSTPEPISILGSLLAVGMGFVLKRKQNVS